MEKFTILFEDQDLAVISKPTDIVVNSAVTVAEPTIQDWWEKRLQAEKQLPKSGWESLVPADFPVEFGTAEEIFAQRGGIVHRLDKETSGVMLLAKNPGVLANLLRQFRLRETEKMYTCLVHDKFTILEDTLKLPLSRSTQNRTKFSVAADGRSAETAYKVLETYPALQDLSFLPPGGKLKKKIKDTYQGFSLVQCWPKTGRTHQIRVHMSHIRHPIVTDPTYLGKKRHALDELWCPRLFLHATTLSFTHPRTGKRMEIADQLPADLQKALTYLQLPE